MRDVHVNLIILIDTLSRECNFKYIRTRIELFYTRLLMKMVISLISNIIYYYIILMQWSHSASYYVTIRMYFVFYVCYLIRFLMSTDFRISFFFIQNLILVMRPFKFDYVLLPTLYQLPMWIKVSFRLQTITIIFYQTTNFFSTITRYKIDV